MCSRRATPLRYALSPRHRRPRPPPPTMSSSMSSAYVSALKSCLNEDTHDAARRGEGMSKMETRFENEAAEAAKPKEGEWLAATASGEVAVMHGEPNAEALGNGPGETDIDTLRRMRIAQMKAHALQKQRWLMMGHGKYIALNSDAEFLRETPLHAQMVCHLWTDSIDCEMLHYHMRTLCTVHLETFFCSLKAEAAPMMLNMVKLQDLPALLLCRDGKVVHQLTGIDRSFTTEGVAYELAQHKLVDFEADRTYGKAAGGCTTQSAGRHRDVDDDDDDEYDY
uniref:Thioredoxin domain-containing protein n=1 Tax=Chrysotila carterae TaxID=13221 RepID=A0A7S4FCX4_CHRCT